MAKQYRCTYFSHMYRLSRWLNEVKLKPEDIIAITAASETMVYIVYLEDAEDAEDAENA